MKLSILLVGWLVSCLPSDESQVQTNQGGAFKQSWFKTPEEIKSTIEGYGIEIDGNEQLLYFDKLSELYGGKNIHQHRTMLVEPTGVYLLALDTLSNWLSCELIFKELSTGIVFKGGLFPANREPDCDACYANEEKDWCDCDDKITIGEKFNEKPISLADKKRIMHNIQDLGDFLGVAIDNKLAVKPNTHAADYLYQEVFIPNLSAEFKFSCLGQVNLQSETSDQSDDSSDAPEWQPAHEEAWRMVIHTILMSGPFYLNLDNREY